MGLFSRLTKKKTVAQEKKTYTVPELTEFLRAESPRSSENLITELALIYARIEEAARKIQAEAESINSVQPDSEMFKPLSQTLKNTKRLYVEGIQHNIDPVLGLRLDSYEECVEASKKFISSINIIHNLEKKYIRFVKFGFKDHVVELRKSLNDLAVASNEFFDKIKTADESMEKNNEMLALLTSHAELKDKIGSLDTDLPTLRKDAKELAGAEKKLEREFKALDDSAEKTVHDKLDKELAELRNRQADIESRVQHVAGQLARPLRKYKRTVEGLGEKGFVDYVELCISSPSELVRREPRMNELLKKLGDTVERDGIKLDDKERDKVLGTIQNSLSIDMDAIIRQHAELRSISKEKAGSLQGSVHSKRKKELDTEVSALRERRSTHEKKVEIGENELKEVKEKLGELELKINEGEYNVQLGVAE